MKPAYYQKTLEFVVQTDILLPPRNPDRTPDYHAIHLKRTRMKGAWNGHIPQRWTKGIVWFPDFERDRWNFRYRRKETLSESEARVRAEVIESVLQHVYDTPPESQG